MFFDEKQCKNCKEKEIEKLSFIHHKMLPISELEVVTTIIGGELNKRHNLSGSYYIYINY